ncbi:hypothetical protein [Pseudomonas neuropathica]|uniref:hypothetical protein n=1 Tax=Pseudomonas neuropathica TaxID=2730425 RepID=UPI003EBC5213
MVTLLTSLRFACQVMLMVLVPITLVLAADVTPEERTFLPVALKDWIVIGSTVVSIFIAFWGVKNGLQSARKAIDEKQNEHRQKQLAAARDMIKEIFSDPLARSAMRMMDWSGRNFTYENQCLTVHWRDLKPALVVHQQGMGFDKQQEFIRDCFESFFDHMLVLEHFIEQRYLNEADIAVPLEYYAGQVMNFPQTYDGFLLAYGYGEARDLLQRLALRRK